MPTSPLLALAAALTGLTLVGSPFVPAAHAANELCGQTITQNVTLTADQSCTGHGLVVGADGITIDLGGFTLSGDRGAGDVGIDVAPFSKVKIRNGVVRNFGTGILSDGGDAQGGLQITHVTVRNNVGRGGFLSLCSAKIVRSSFIGNGNGGLELVGLCPKGVAVDASTFVGNSATGLRLTTSNGKAKATKLIVSGNENHGVELRGANISLQSSTIAANGGDGVQVLVAAAGDAIKKNVIVGNGGDGVLVDVPATDAKGPNLLASNLVYGNRGNGVRVMNDGAKFALSGNRVIGNALNGVSIETSGAITVKGNQAVGNGLDGLVTTNAVTLFTKNLANGNTFRGILAPTGLDGGGNTARGNRGGRCSDAIACPAPFTSKVGSAIPACGLHVTSSITLGADSPVCADQDGLLIDGDGVTVDLNGHRLRGDGTANRFGIVVSGKDVTITNGIVDGFGIGISTSQGATGLKLVNVAVEASESLGVFIAGADSLVSKVVITDTSGAGLVLDDDAAGSVVSSTFLVGNIGEGLRSRCPGGTITNVTSIGNAGAGIILSEAGDGKLQGAISALNFSDGIRIGPGFGILAPAVLKKSLVVGNDLNGVQVSSNSVALIIDSIFAGGNGNEGIVLTGLPQNTIVKKNALVGNLSNGLFVDVAVGPTSLLQNRAVGNVATGFNVAAATTTLTKNAAFGNSSAGISTPFGAIDGGGNVAADNGGTEECTAPIVCE